MSNDARLGEFLREVSGWDWAQFHRAEYDKQYSSNQAMIFGLVRACAMEKMEAIKLSINRLDGKLKTPVKIETPKVYMLFPNAKLPEGAAPAGLIGRAERVVVDEVTPYQPTSGQVLENGDIEFEDITIDGDDLATMSIRQTLSKMSDYPRDVPELIVERATQTDQACMGNGPMPEEVPMVKSVIAAHLLIMAQKRDLSAITEVFDNIDGKLTETIKVLGEDIYITNYSTIAPENAYLNDDGVLQLEAEQAQELWASKLGAISGK